MMEFTSEFLRRTINIWQKYSSIPLTLEDAKEIAENMTELFSFLVRLDKKYGNDEAESNDYTNEWLTKKEDLHE